MFYRITKLCNYSPTKTNNCVLNELQSCFKEIEGAHFTKAQFDLVKLTYKIRLVRISRVVRRDETSPGYNKNKRYYRRG